MKNMKHLFALACVAVASPALAQMDFGGMYGFGNNQNYANPYTGGQSCPTGYAAYRILGTPGIDNNLFFCGRTPNGTTPVADFGGMYGYGSPNNYPNPFTGGFSCPAGFTATKVLGTVNIDYSAFVCHRTGTRSPLVTFGGMFGGYFKDGNHLTYPNPLTAADTCPSTFSASATLGTVNVDYGVLYCYK
jgi:hypothetical protein